MPQGKQAKALSEAQVRTSLSHLAGTRNPERDTAIFMLSIKAGLRAKEIASLRWSMITDPEGHVADAMELQDAASKGNGGRTIPLHKDLRAALVRLKDHTEARRAAIGQRAGRAPQPQFGSPLVQAAVCVSGVRRMLQPLGPPDVHHQGRQEGFGGWWIASRCPTTCRPRLVADHPALRRGQH